MSFLRYLVFVLVGAVVSLPAQTTVPTVSRTVPTQTLAPGGAAVTVSVSDYFTVPGVAGQVVVFDTVLGKFAVELRADAAPQQVANFLGYVQRGDYVSSFFHRSASLEPSGAISIIQGGGYTMTASGATAIPTQAAVPLEYNLPNERGTLAAARLTDINSATSQWYFNVRDNTSILGPSNGGGYTVFGRVIGTGMTVVDAIAALPRVDAGSPFNELPVRNYTTGNVTTANLALVTSISRVSLFPSAGSNSLVTFSVQNSSPSVVAATITSGSLTLTPVGPGTATVTVRATDVTGSFVDNAFTVTVASTAPTITAQPAAQTTIANGNTVVLSATASAAVTYQWQRNGADVPGATNAQLVVRNATSANAGTYTLIARNAIGSTTSSAAVVTVSTPAPSDVGRLVNLAIRSNAGTGDQTLIVGFSLSGSGTAPLLLRGVGPSLAQFGLSGVLADPIATLYSGSTVVASNNNWAGDAQVDARAKQVGAFAFTSTSSLDAAMAISPMVGSYTMQVTGNAGATGTALAEIYDAATAASYTTATPRLVNVSARTQVGTGDNVLIAGFVIGGTTSKTVLIRGVGPTLASFGVSGVLSDPYLQLFRAGSVTPLATNDDWGGDPQLVATATVVGAFQITNGASKDAALLITLPPGAYTAQMSGVNGGTGVGLVEVYEVP